MAENAETEGTAKVTSEEEASEPTKAAADVVAPSSGEGEPDAAQAKE